MASNGPIHLQVPSGASQMKLLGLGDYYNGEIVTDISRHGIITASGRVYNQAFVEANIDLCGRPYENKRSKRRVKRIQSRNGKRTA
jgi:hypothetical protein